MGSCQRFYFPKNSLPNFSSQAFSTSSVYSNCNFLPQVAGACSFLKCFQGLPFMYPLFHFESSELSETKESTRSPVLWGVLRSKWTNTIPSELDPLFSSRTMRTWFAIFHITAILAGSWCKAKLKYHKAFLLLLCCHPFLDLTFA